MRASRKDFSYFGIQLLLLAAYFIPIKWINFESPIIIKIIGLSFILIGFSISVIAILQLKKKLSPFPTPAKNSKLRTRGIYRFIRHPIYTGLILMTFGYGILSGSVWKLVFAVLLTVFFYIKTVYEEDMLMKEFDEYEAYQKKTGRLFPKLTKRKKA